MLMTPAHYETEQPALPWRAGALYVVGHQRPDMDAIASALAYAWLLTQQGEVEVEAARAGPLPAQSVWALRRFGTKAPGLLISVAPTFAHVCRSGKSLAPEAPLAEALPLFGAGAAAVPVVDVEGMALGLVTSASLATALATAGEGYEAALTRSCSEVMEWPRRLPADARIADYLPSLLRLDADEFLVEGPDGRYVGTARRADLLHPTRARLALVDHNEPAQSVPGAEQAEIVLVLDHHRLGNAPTAQPIRFQVEPVGSTCTLVAELCRRDALTPPEPLLGLMLCGILSDTMVLRSPTTTDRDREIAAYLAARLQVDWEALGSELLQSGLGMHGRDAAVVLEADRKQYVLGSRRVTVAQVEAAGFGELEERRGELFVALEVSREREALSLAALMVTDVVAGRSRMLAVGEPALLAAMPFPRVGPNEWELGEIVSRKKQLVPALIALLEETPASGG
jgi:manganese-dependent inorganic pyrophosphatase